MANGRRIKSSMRNMEMQLLTISMNDLFLENKVQVIKIVVEAVWKNECMSHHKNRSRKKYISGMKRDIAVQIIVDLSIIRVWNNRCCIKSLGIRKWKVTHRNQLWKWHVTLTALVLIMTTNKFYFSINYITATFFFLPVMPLIKTIWLWML